MDRNKENYLVGPFWKCARIGERLSPYVSIACVVMAVSSSFRCTGKRGKGKGKGEGEDGERKRCGGERRKNDADDLFIGY